MILIKMKTLEGDDDAYQPGDDCQSCGMPASECGHIRPETPDPKPRRGHSDIAEGQAMLQRCDPWHGGA